MTAMFITRGRRTVCALAVGDALLMLLGIGALAQLDVGVGEPASLPAAQLALMAGFVPFQLVALYAFGLQAPTAGFRGWRYGARLALALALGLTGLGLVNGLCGLVIAPAVLVGSLLALFCVLFAARYVVLGLVFPRSRRKRLAVVGELPAVFELVRRIRA